MHEAVIVSSVRTPIGRANKGALKAIRADDLAATAVRGALDAVPQLDRARIEDLILGCAFPEGEQGMNLARLITLLVGLPETVAGVTINRFCASSLQAINMAAQAIMLGQGEAIIAAGVESMSRVPMGGFNPSFNPLLARHEACGFPDAYIPMGITAENVATRYGISREEQDAFALRSHRRAIEAADNGFFARSIVPVTLPDGTQVTRDEGPRRDTSAERLAALEPAFIQGGTVTAGNASPLNDGAAACIVISAELARELGLTPLARVRAMAVAGVAPEVMGIGPVPAVRKVLERAGIDTRDLDAIELNEAFAAQSLAVIRDLALDEARVNPHGGAIALGHPLGCSGARIMSTLIDDLIAGDGTLGVATMCVGGGQGVATVIERLN
ncbi:MAG TPA: thiolase family protein [Chloroflexota bacterium]|nr:thiolase family protein [Chloroflexota bacterium]